MALRDTSRLWASGLVPVFITAATLVVMAFVVIVGTKQLAIRMYRGERRLPVPLLTELYMDHSWAGLLLPVLMGGVAMLIGKVLPESRVWQNVNAGAFLVLGILYLAGGVLSWLLPLQ